MTTRLHTGRVNAKNGMTGTSGKVSDLIAGVATTVRVHMRDWGAGGCGNPNPNPPRRFFLFLFIYLPSPHRHPHPSPLQLAKKTAESLDTIAGARPRIPFLPIEDLLISVMLLANPHPVNLPDQDAAGTGGGASEPVPVPVKCTRYQLPYPKAAVVKHTATKTFYADFVPFWLRNKRELSHIQERAKMIASGKVTTNYSFASHAGSAFYRDACASWVADEERAKEIIAEIMLLKADEDFNEMRFKFSKLVVRKLSPLVSDAPSHLAGPRAARFAHTAPLPSRLTATFIFYFL